jgi:hypothetical protein
MDMDAEAILAPLVIQRRGQPLVLPAAWLTAKCVGFAVSEDHRCNILSGWHFVTTVDWDVVIDWLKSMPQLTKAALVQHLADSEVLHELYRKTSSDISHEVYAVIKHYHHLAPFVHKYWDRILHYLEPLDLEAIANWIVNTARELEGRRCYSCDNLNCFLDPTVSCSGFRPEEGHQ